LTHPTVRILDPGVGIIDHPFLSVQPLLYLRAHSFVDTVAFPHVIFIFIFFSSEACHHISRDLIVCLVQIFFPFHPMYRKSGVI